MHCAHRTRCPGCPLIELAYEEQLAWKHATFRHALAAYPTLAQAPVLPTAAAEPISDYRVRAKLVVQGEALGLFARGTHEVVDIPECRVLRPSLAAVAGALRRELPLAPAISSLDLREAEAGVLVTVAVPSHTEPRERRALAETIAGLSTEIASVAVSTRGDDAPQLLGQGLEVLVGPGELRHQPDPEAPWHYAAHGAFTQAHGGQLARLHRAIEEEVRSARAPTTAAPGAPPLAGATVLELYAGSGALALRLAARGASTTAVETFAPAARMAERAAKEQALAVAIVCGDAARTLQTLERQRAHFDAIIVDPPRRGLAPEVRRSLAALAPSRLLYVSCYPESFARDAAHLGLLGLRLAQATPFDMIPLSDAVESLGRFVPGSPPAPVVLAEDDTFLAVSKEPHEAASAHDDGPSLTRRVRQLAGASEATLVAGLEPGASGVCVFARRRADVATLVGALAGSHSHFTLLVRGVTHGRGRLGRAGAATRYERREVVAGHSVLVLTLPAGDPSAACRTLAQLRHPLLGDERHGDRRANAHFSHRHLLDRPFLHRHALTLPLATGEVRVEAPLAPDLEHTLGSLRERRGP